MSIWHFADLLPVVAEKYRVTLGEGNTPLVRSRQIGPAIGMPNLYFKLEISNPTGSYKDRFAASAVSHMQQAGDHTIVATSSGNTGSALAAYAAAAKMPCAIAIVETAPEGKLKQMLAYGARLYRVEGFGVDADVSAGVFNYLVELGEKPGTQVQISCFKHCPDGMAGVKTIGYELAQQSQKLHKPLDHVLCPAGGGGLALATALGLIQAVEWGEIDRQASCVCLVTGSGFKDPPCIDRMISDAVCPTVAFENLQMT